MFLGVRNQIRVEVSCDAFLANLRQFASMKRSRFLRSFLSCLTQSLTHVINNASYREHRVLQTIETKGLEMVSRAGLEPATLCLKGRCSTT